MLSLGDTKMADGGEHKVENEYRDIMEVFKEDDLGKVLSKLQAFSAKTLEDGAVLRNEIEVAVRQLDANATVHLAGSIFYLIVGPKCDFDFAIVTTSKYKDHDRFAREVACALNRITPAILKFVTFADTAVVPIVHGTHIPTDKKVDIVIDLKETLDMSELLRYVALSNPVFHWLGMLVKYMFERYGLINTWPRVMTSTPLMLALICYLQRMSNPTMRELYRLEDNAGGARETPVSVGAWHSIFRKNAIKRHLHDLQPLLFDFVKFLISFDWKASAMDVRTLADRKRDDFKVKDNGCVIVNPFAGNEVHHWIKRGGGHENAASRINLRRMLDGLHELAKSLAQQTFVPPVMNSKRNPKGSELTRKRQFEEKSRSSGDSGLETRRKVREECQDRLIAGNKYGCGRMRHPRGDYWQWRRQVSDNSEGAL